MNSLEDAYVNIAKAEEKLHNEERNVPLEDLEKSGEHSEDFQRYLSASANPAFCSQVSGMFVRRLKQFARETRMQILLASPFVTIIFTYFLVSGLIYQNSDNPDVQRTRSLILSFLFSFFVLTGFSLCTGLFILAPVADRQQNLRQMLNFVGMKPLAYYTGSFLADLILFTIPTVGFIALLFPMGINYLYMDYSWAVFLALMVSFGLSLIALTYLIAFLFSNANTAFKIIGLVYFICGCILPTVVGGVITALSRDESTMKTIKYFYTVIPFQNFSDGMTYILLGNIFAEQFGKDSDYYK